jgi:hypothetical protein
LEERSPFFDVPVIIEAITIFFSMNIKTQLLEAIEQAPDSVIQETFNFLSSAQSDYLHSQSAGEAILSLLNQTPLNPEDLKNLPSDLASQHDHYLYGVPKSD